MYYNTQKTYCQEIYFLKKIKKTIDKLKKVCYINVSKGLKQKKYLTQTNE